MKIVSPLLLGLSLAVVGSSLAAAQQAQAPSQEMQMQGPPKVLSIDRMLIKPGKSGAMYDKAANQVVAALAKAKWPTHGVALNSLSGKSRALFISGYPSFDAMEKDNAAFEKNTALSAEIGRDIVAAGDPLDEFDQAVLTYDEDLSLRPVSSLANVRFMEIDVIKIKPGHMKDWSDLVKLIIDAEKKGNTSSQWAMYRVAYGGGGEYVNFHAYKSMAEIDARRVEGKKFFDAVGEDGMKKLDELSQACIESENRELFQINPRQSYPAEDWVKADPGFWNPKPPMEPAAAAKPLPAAKMPPK
jgi:hypothetical protein